MNSMHVLFRNRRRVRPPPRARARADVHLYDTAIKCIVVQRRTDAPALTGDITRADDSADAD
jgi:hypothetical protein